MNNKRRQEKMFHKIHTGVVPVLNRFFDGRARFIMDDIKVTGTADAGTRETVFNVEVSFRSLRKYERYKDAFQDLLNKS